jgi:hypothetical protein
MPIRKIMPRAFQIGTIESIGPRGSDIIEHAAQEGLFPTQLTTVVHSRLMTTLTLKKACKKLTPF